MMQFLESPLDDVSANPGCHPFTLMCDGGFDLNTSTKEVLEIDMPTCDVLVMTMSTEDGSFMQNEKKIVLLCYSSFKLYAKVNYAKNRFELLI